MIEHTLDTANHILYLRPKSALEKDDFVKLAAAVDPHIEIHGQLAGLIVEAPRFPGWKNFGAMAARFRFLRNHHKKIIKIAILTESVMGKVGEHLGSRIMSPEFKRFSSNELEVAKRWVMNRP